MSRRRLPRQRQCARWTHRGHIQRTLRNVFNVNIFPICILSWWNPVFAEPCAVNSSRASSFDSTRDACYPREGWGEAARVKTTHLAYLYRACRVCSRNIKYKGKYFNIGRQTHTNNGACSSVCAYIRVPLCISVCNVPDLMERPEKNAAAAPTNRKNKHDFPGRRKIRCFSFTRSVMHPSIAKFHLNWIDRVENNLQISILYSICPCSLTVICIMLYINMFLHMLHISIQSRFLNIAWFLSRNI